MSYRRNADTKGRSVFPGDVLGNFGVDAGFGFDVFGEGAIAVIRWVT